MILSSTSFSPLAIDCRLCSFIDTSMQWKSSSRLLVVNDAVLAMVTILQLVKFWRQCGCTDGNFGGMGTGHSWYRWWWVLWIRRMTFRWFRGRRCCRMWWILMLQRWIWRICHRLITLEIKHAQKKHRNSSQELENDTAMQCRVNVSYCSETKIILLPFIVLWNPLFYKFIKHCTEKWKYQCIKISLKNPNRVVNLFELMPLFMQLRAHNSYVCDLCSFYVIRIMYFVMRCRLSPSQSHQWPIRIVRRTIKKYIVNRLSKAHGVWFTSPLAYTYDTYQRPLYQLNEKKENWNWLTGSATRWWFLILFDQYSSSFRCRSQVLYRLCSVEI